MGEMLFGFSGYLIHILFRSVSVSVSINMFEVDLVEWGYKCNALQRCQGVV
ncbi:hypothetical protein AG1IA_03654 [Rhizoctonia solani AG-1 IA]|uniref:Uncharacterized protein n=1 Tax=Thanatephorus cucumeris (strain AG1-IA) TaxID=983506 RepID=L8WW76_THACA|nr:hypothetical protein AG1IA_03654 [Rhizoctonia solani AG-1 IA]